MSMRILAAVPDPGQVPTARCLRFHGRAGGRGAGLFRHPGEMAPLRATGTD